MGNVAMNVERGFFIALVLLLGTVLLCSCIANKGKPKVYVMQNPKTMEFKNCEAGRIGLQKDYAKSEECVKELQKQGWIIWGTQ